MLLYNRVIFVQDFTSDDITIPAHTIGTVRGIRGDGRLLQIDYDNEKRKEKLVFVPISLLRNSIPEDLDKLETLSDCLKILNYRVHPGTQYHDYRQNKEFEICGIRLAINELRDYFKIAILPSKELQEELVDLTYINTAIISRYSLN
jgi:hypothetical protein